jgi:hypothetical protein
MQKEVKYKKLNRKGCYTALKIKQQKRQNLKKKYGVINILFQKLYFIS